MGGITKKNGTEWYDGCSGHALEIAPRDTAAQVIPAKITEALFAASKAELVIGTPTAMKKITSNPTGKVEKKEKTTYTVSVQTADGQDGGGLVELSCDLLLLACGPWTR